MIRRVKIPLLFGLLTAAALLAPARGAEDLNDLQEKAIHRPRCDVLLRELQST